MFQHHYPRKQIAYIYNSIIKSPKLPNISIFQFLEYFRVDDSTTGFAKVIINLITSISWNRFHK